MLELSGAILTGGADSAMEIVLYPHPALRRVARPVAAVTDAVRQVAQEMIALMEQAEGLGLAANQVALPIRLFVVSAAVDPWGEQKPRVFINPEIVRREGQSVREEGCLSLPGLYAEVARAERILVRAQNEEGEAFELELEDLAARVVQHEWDHLRGILFIDRLMPTVLRRLLPQIRALEREYRRRQQAGELPSDQELERLLGEATAAYAR